MLVMACASLTAIIHVASNLPVVLVVGEVKAPTYTFPLMFLCWVSLLGGVAHRLAVVNAQTDADQEYCSYLHGQHGIFVGYLKLVWTLGTLALNPVAATETVGVQTCQNCAS